MKDYTIGQSKQGIHTLLSQSFVRSSLLHMYNVGIEKWALNACRRQIIMFDWNVIYVRYLLTLVLLCNGTNLFIGLNLRYFYGWIFNTPCKGLKTAFYVKLCNKFLFTWIPKSIKRLLFITSYITYSWRTRWRVICLCCLAR